MAVAKKKGTVAKKGAVKKGGKVAAKKTAPKYEGGALKITKKNVAALNSILSGVDTMTLTPEESTAFEAAQKTVAREYKRYQKSLPKAQRAS